MIWRWRWKLFDQTSQSIIKTPSFGLGYKPHTFSSPITCLIDKPRLSFAAIHNQQSPIILTPQIVQSTLLKCPSDLIALTFFLWCARQRDYFHDRAAFDHMVDVITRLTHRLGPVSEILEQLKTVGFVTKPQILLLLLRIYWHGGKHTLVFETFEEMFKYGYTPNTYARNIVMDVLFKIGRVSVALRVLNDTQVPNFLTYSIAICNLCRLGDMSNIQYVLRSMLRKGYYLNAETFYAVLNCFCKMGRLGEALQLYGLMTKLGVPISVNTWSILIDGFCKSGKLDMAVCVLEKMVEAGCTPNVVTCTSFIKGFMESRMPNDAFRILRTMESKGYSCDLVLCNVLIDCLSKMGRYDDALDLYVSFPERKLMPDSYTFCSLMSLVCLSRQFALLPRLVRGLPVQADIVLCNSILSYLCKVGYPSAAIDYYDDMIDRGLSPDKYSFSGLLRGLCGAGRIDEAVNVYRGIVMKHVGLDAHIHTVIVDGLIKAGKFHRAIRLFREAAANKYPLDVVSYTVAINGLLRAGRFEEAYTLYSQMKKSGMTLNAKTYNVMISGFCRERDVEKVKQILQEMIDAGTKLDHIAWIRINNFLFKSCFSNSILNELIEFLDRLMPNSAISAPLVNGLAHGVEVGAAYLPFSKSDMVGSLDVGSIPSSEDLPVVAASVG